VPSADSSPPLFSARIVPLGCPLPAPHAPGMPTKKGDCVPHVQLRTKDDTRSTPPAWLVGVINRLILIQFSLAGGVTDKSQVPTVLVGDIRFGVAHDSCGRKIVEAVFPRAGS
jgi:hypothetical protein